MHKRITTVSLMTFSAEQLHAIVSKFGDFEHVQLTNGPFRGQLMRSYFGDSILDMNSYSQDVLVRGSYPPDRITLGFIMSGREAGYFNGMRFAVNDIIVIAEGAAMDAYRLPAGTHLVGLQTDRSRLEREGIAIPARSRIVCYSSLCPETLQLGRQLKSLVMRPRGARITSTQCAPGNGLIVEDDLIAGFRRAIDGSQDNNARPYDASLQCRASILRKFEEVVQRHLSSELRIPDLCASIGIGQRTLENLCNDYYGMSPRRYMTVRRLNAVRDRLLRGAAGPVSIAKIAGGFGFRHAGRFSQTYRSLFGELPSQTAK
jgi:AraC-like DNA-binding protein